MRARRWASILVATAVTGAAPALAAGRPEPDLSRIESEVLEAHARMNTAAESRDVQAFFEWILDEPGVAIIQDGRLFRDRAEAMTAVREGYRGVTSLARTFERTRVTPLSEDAALVTAAGTSTVVLADGRSLEGPFAVSLVFVRRAGDWKLLQGHYSIPTPR